ncbi:hypothetical protein K493DRAFT_296922 [Basidiobolus meristosporus CBS 931.73]|uniref:FR47-like domain-containing protein n=1 Tax=Basidiobolus meristosporus CBS 931.73 TaxID=1314790 RepID=A0A1Y1Z2Z0_9FUNG|nr:hypothetical protein K493DRAFT_296922 [Basidiobolus meristosporus CBS 931.73]|eukprot:ORY04648.1 hypothetical protein K493DRAFT_296922 [Basidiobolus meristosporus CBS 931.73]
MTIQNSIPITPAAKYLEQIEYPFTDKETETSVFRWLISNLPTSSSLLGVLVRPFATPSQFPNSTEEDGRIPSDCPSGTPLLFTNVQSLITGELSDVGQVGVFLHYFGSSLKVYVSTESVLSFEKHNVQENGYAVFEREEMQTLYDESVRVLTDILDNCFNFRLTGKVGYRIPSFKLSLASSSLPLEGVNVAEKMKHNQELIDDSLSDKDLEQTLEYNKLKFPRAYMDDCAKISHCLRSSRTGQPVSWGMTHGDMAVACLHTLGEYRQRSLGRKVMYELALKHVALHQRHLPYKAGETVYVHADTEIWNEATVEMMHKCGYKNLLTNEWFSVVLDEHIDTAKE